MSSKHIVKRKHQSSVGEKTVTVRVSGKAIEQLTILKEQSKANTFTDVIKNALRTYDVLSDYRATDGSVIVEALNGKRIQLFLP